MQENRDGSFEQIQELSEFFEEMTNPEKDWSKVKSLHFGTPEELEEIKTEKLVGDRLDILEDQMKELLDKPESNFIIEPTKEEIKQFGSGPMRREMLNSMNIVSAIRRE